MKHETTAGECQTFTRVMMMCDVEKLIKEERANIKALLMATHIDDLPDVIKNL